MPISEHEALRQAVERGGFHDANETEWVSRWALAEIERLRGELERERHDAWVALDGTNVKRLREALQAIRDELGVPGPGYPAPVANAANIAAEALKPEARNAR